MNNRARLGVFKAFLFVTISVALFGLVLFRGYLVDEGVAVRAAEVQGYRNIRIVNERRFLALGCGRGDAARFDLKVVNHLDKEVQIYVCVGVLGKGATIRTW